MGEDITNSHLEPNSGLIHIHECISVHAYAPAYMRVCSLESRYYVGTHMRSTCIICSVNGSSRASSPSVSSLCFLHGA